MKFAAPTSLMEKSRVTSMEEKISKGSLATTYRLLYWEKGDRSAWSLATNMYHSRSFEFLATVGEASVKLYSEYSLFPDRVPQSLMQVHKRCCSSPFSIEQIAEDEKLVRFYTGFKDYDTLIICYDLCTHHLLYWNMRTSHWETQEARGAPRLLSPLNDLFS